MDHISQFQPCLYSQYLAVEIIPSTSATAVIPAVDLITTDFSIPYKLGTDNSSSFNSHQFKNFTRRKGSEHVHVTSHAPWANDTAEHFIYKLGKLLITSNVVKRTRKPSLEALFKPSQLGLFLKVCLMTVP